MDYGKLAYLKVSELEKLKTGNVEVKENNNISCFEINKELNQAISEEYTVNFATITPSENCDCCIFLNFKIIATQESLVEIKLLFSNMVVATLSKTLKVGENEINMTSVASTVLSGEGQLSAKITTNKAITLSSFSLISIGAGTKEASSNIELKACANKDAIAISFIKNGVIYYYEDNATDLNTTTATWSTFKSAITHSVCYDIYNSANPVLTFLYVGLDNNLYLSRLGANEETFIDSGVSSVCVGNSFNSDDPCMLIVYVKNGKVLYKTLASNVLSEANELGLPEANYVSVRTLSSQNTKNYIIATDKNENNYICSSVVSPKISKLMENVKFSIDLTLETFIEKFNGDLDIENVSLKLVASVISYRFANSLYNMTEITNLVTECNVMFECYEAIDNTTQDAITYGVDFDSVNGDAVDGIGNCVYVGDCAGFTPASLDFTDINNPVFTEGSWVNKWPYNLIKPCLMKDGEIVCYLNRIDFTKSEDGSITNIDVTSGNMGEVMVEIPKIYYRIHRTENGVYEFRISNKKQFGYCCFGHYFKDEVLDKIYIGAYATSLKDNKPYSLSGKTKYRLVQVTQHDVSALSSTKGERYGMPTMNTCLMLQMLYIIYFKSLDYKKSVGYGYTYSSMTGYMKTGLGDNYPAWCYGYYNKDNKSIDKMFSIEGFCSFASYCLDGVNALETGAGFMDVEGPHNRWVDDTNFRDYMYYESPFGTGTLRSVEFVVNNCVGLFATNFINEKFTWDKPMDFGRYRITKLGGESYRLHFSNLGTANLGLFSYLISEQNYNTYITGHRLIYYKPNEED